MTNEEAYQAGGVPEAERPELRADAATSAEVTQADTLPEVPSVESPAMPPEEPVRKRARRVRSHPDAGVREPRTRKRSKLAVTQDAPELEPELLAVIGNEHTAAAPAASDDVVHESMTNGAASDVAGEAASVTETAVEPPVESMQDGEATEELSPADLPLPEAEPVGWIANGNGAMHADHLPVEDAAPAPAAAAIDASQSVAWQEGHRLAPLHQTEVVQEDRWHHHDYARAPEPEPQPEPPAFLPAARAEAAVVDDRERSYADESRAEPSVVTKRVARTRFRDNFKLHLSLIAIIPILLGALIPGVVAYLSPEVYAARSEIVLNISSLEWSAAERFRATQLVVVKARSTLAPIAEAANLPLRDLEENLEATMVGSSDVISIQFANRDPSIALEVVEAVTAQYLTDLRDFEQLRNGRHRMLLTPTLLDEPVSLSPLRAAMIGAIVGLVIAVAGIALRTQLRPVK